MIVTCDTTRSKMLAPCDIRRPEDDDRATRSSHPPLSYPRNRKRQLPLQKQLGECRQTHKGEISELDERLTSKPLSSRVSSQWKSRVTSQRKSTTNQFDASGQLRPEARRSNRFEPYSQRDEARRAPPAYPCSGVDCRKGIWAYGREGEPIDEIVAQQLFQPFFRGKGRSSNQGLGLGLYIASEIARAHGGKIDVASSKEETRFTLHIPAA